jgi:hypothetical protein
MVPKAEVVVEEETAPKAGKAASAGAGSTTTRRPRPLPTFQTNEKSKR